MKSIRRLLIALLAFASLAALPGHTSLRASVKHGQGQAPTPSTRLNVLFIAVDDLNDWIGALGKRADVKTELAKWLPKVNVPDAPNERGGGQER